MRFSGIATPDSRLATAWPVTGRTFTFLLPPVDEPGLLGLFPVMPRDLVILECTEARKEGKPVSRYVTSRNKKLQTAKVEKKKYNPHLRRHTMHKEVSK